LDDLPLLPPPSRIVVGRNCYEIDGWFFSLHQVPKGALQWRKGRLDRWQEIDPGEDNKRWLGAFLAALEDALLATFKKPGPGD
jgi:hypothetical protein